MAWPLKLRTLSFAITFGVVMMECAVWGVPIGLGLWYWGSASAISIVTWMIWISLGISLVISGQAHVRGQRYRANPRRRVA